MVIKWNILEHHGGFAFVHFGYSLQFAMQAMAHRNR
jgi:hypothetical protein